MRQALPGMVDAILESFPHCLAVSCRDTQSCHNMQVVMSELNKLATFKSKIGELATVGLKILQTVLDSKIAHVQL